jgi:hypothetical protein
MKQRLKIDNNITLINPHIREENTKNSMFHLVLEKMNSRTEADQADLDRLNAIPDGCGYTDDGYVINLTSKEVIGVFEPNE